MHTETQRAESFVQPSRAVLEELVHAASLAPSPDNNQPWRFEQNDEGELLLLHDRTRVLPSDVDDMFSRIALGAALENLCLAAGRHGWRALVRHPADDEPNPLDALIAPIYPRLHERQRLR